MLEAIIVVCLAHATAADVMCQSASLTVVVSNVRSASGVLRVTLFTRERDYMKDFTNARVVKAAVGEVTVSFDSPAPGYCAVTVFHDENNNGKLDSNFFRMPREGVGFSNDASATFGPPSWAKAKFSVAGRSTTTQIALKYF
jgi:uncharacterized protein (DUF2141 family)